MQKYAKTICKHMQIYANDMQIYAIINRAFHVPEICKYMQNRFNSYAKICKIYANHMQNMQNTSGFLPTYDVVRQTYDIV